MIINDINSSTAKTSDVWQPHLIKRQNFRKYVAVDYINLDDYNTWKSKFTRCHKETDEKQNTAHQTVVKICILCFTWSNKPNVTELLITW